MPANVSILSQAAGLKNLVDRELALNRATFAVVAAVRRFGEWMRDQWAGAGAVRNLDASLGFARIAFAAAKEF